MHEAHHLLKPTIIGFVLFLGWTQITLVRTDKWPTVPLAVKSPYLSVWTNGPYIGQERTRFWTSDENTLTLLVRLNGKTYKIAPDGDIWLQTGLKVTPTQSIFNFTIGPVILTFNFFTPIESNDLKRLSLPVSYVAVSARSTDNHIHPVEIFMGWWGDWLTADAKEIIRWNSQQLGPLFDLSMENMNQTQFYESFNGPRWGTFHVFTNSLDTTYGIKNIDNLESYFRKKGRLHNTKGPKFRPYIFNDPAMGFAKDLYAGPSPSPNVFFGISRVAKPAVNTMDGPMNHLWEDFFNGDEKEMIKFAFEDAEGALAQCEALDNKIVADAAQHGGQNYSDIVSLALRQAFGGIELVGTQNRAWAFIKDLGIYKAYSTRCQRVDLIYANMPVHLYLNPKLLKYLLEPLLVYQESGLFAEQWAISDLGDAYPQCAGGFDRFMGVEQSANMIIMIDAYVRASNDTDFAIQHYNISKKWAEYLVTNGLYPGSALTSDDFLGTIVNSTNLSLKAIIGIAAMADIANKVNNIAEYSHYRSIAENYAAQWIRLSQDSEQTHIKFSYNDETAESWVLLYNLYADFLLGTNLVPHDVIMLQQFWYLLNIEKYGIPLRSGTKDSKVDWLLFTAAASPIKTVRKAIYDRVARLWHDELNGIPFRDHFSTVFSRVYYNYINRPTVGAVFAPLTTIARKNTTFLCGWDLNNL